MIIDLKRSIDLRWFFDPVLFFILRWSYFHKSWEKVEKDFQMTKKLTQGALCCWGDGQPRLVDVQLPEVENGRLVGSGLVLVAQPGQPAASWSCWLCWSHFGWLSLEPATAAGGLRQLAEPLSMQQLQSLTNLHQNCFRPLMGYIIYLFLCCMYWFWCCFTVFFLPTRFTQGSSTQKF